MTKRPRHYSDPLPLTDIVYEIAFALPAGAGWEFIGENWTKDRFTDELQGCKTINSALRRLAPFAREYAANAGE